MNRPAIPKGYKQTDAGVIPQDWDCKPVGQLIAPSTSITYGIVQAGPHVNGGVPYIKSGDMSENNLDLDGLARTSQWIASRYPRSTVRSGELVYSIRASVGSVHIIPPELDGANLTQGTARIAPGEDTDAVYLFSQLKSSQCQNWVSLRTKGTTYREITLETLRQVPIPLPPTKAEQEAIADALSDADALIESLEQLIAKKRQIKQGAMQELLTGRKRLPGFEVKSGHKLTELGIIPEDWEARDLGGGIKLLSGQHVLAKHCNIHGDGVPYITGPADFPNGVIQHTKYTTKPGTICGKNDVLVTVKGSGSGTLVRSDAEYCISRQLMAIRANEWNTGYVFLSLLRNMAALGAAATGLIPGLSRSEILAKMIAIPPTRAEQAAIATVLSNMDAEIAALETKLAKARSIKQGMMQELLTGRIRLV